MAGPKGDDTHKRDVATAVLPSARAARAPSQVPVVFAKRDPRSENGRRKGDSAHPIDVSHDQAIGRFELIRELARGGMGQVFLGRDTALGRKVAIKFLLRDDPQFVQRFIVEARATARCTHENIVTIFEVGEHEGLPYMVLEYLEGKTLSEVLEGKPSLRQFVELMTPVARALERAHEHGIVHRDLKPSNIFVTARGQVKVLDFGVARLVDRGDPDDAGELPQHAMSAGKAFETSNSLVGTLPYMSPEQWGADVVDHLSDIWAFGIMFWRAFTGVHPAGTLEPTALRAWMTDLATPFPSIASRNPTLPRAIVEIVDRCLGKRKASRYQSATELVADLQAFLAPTATTGDACPYRGLAAFGEDDARNFFGRSNEIRTAAAQLAAWPLLAVIGPSGVGKSSFVHAGLVPATRATGGQWRLHGLRPGRAPLARLGAVLEEATGDRTTAFAARIADEPGLFGVALRASAAQRGQRELVVVDQLEELFTLCDDDAARRAFLAALLAAADDPSSPVRVVLSMRADFLDRLASHKEFLAELSRGLFFLSAPDRENLREALVRPAELAGYSFEDPWIVDDMLDAATSRGALPLLSFAATRLWDARDRERKLLTVAAYNAIGGIGGAFARHADEVAAAVPSQSQRLLRAVFARLVTPEGTRAVLDRDELLSLADDRAEVEVVLDHLVRGRLVHVHTEPAHGASVEIVHETLITEWPMLRRWLDDSQALRGFVAELRQAAKQWAARGRPSDLVWRGATARDALAHADRHVLDLAGDERAFLAEITRQLASARRRKVLVFAAIFGALGLVIAGGAVAVVRIKLAEQDATDKAAVAIRERQAADVARADAEKARADVQKQLDVIRDKELARARAEQAAASANRAEALSRDELQLVNQQLERKVAEAQAAEEAARHATADAKAANARTEALLAKERAAREKLEQEKKSIYSKDLRGGPR